MLGMLLVGVLLGQAPDAPKAGGYAALLREYEAAEAAWHRSYDKPEISDVEKPGAIFRYAEWPAWEYAPNFLAIAEADPKGQEALDSLLWIAHLGVQVTPGDTSLFKIHSRAMDLLAQHHLNDPKLKANAGDLGHPVLTAAWERLFRKLSTEATDREVRGLALFGIGKMLATKVEVRRDPWYEKPPASPFAGYVKDRIDPAYFRYIRECNPDATRLEAETTLLRVRDEFGEQKYRNGKLARLADNVLSSMKVVGDGK